jgi:hypothetical protein
LRIREALLRRLIARSRKEKIRSEPFDPEYFWYSFSGISIYVQIVKRTGIHTCWVLAYSGAAPFGEPREIDIGQIDRMTDIHIMTGDDFDKASRLNWPGDAALGNYAEWVLFRVWNDNALPSRNPNLPKVGELTARQPPVHNPRIC